MKKITISIFGNKVFSEILREASLFSNMKIELLEDYKLNTLNNISNNIVVLFVNLTNIEKCLELKNRGIPILVVKDKTNLDQKLYKFFSHQILTPFKLTNFHKKIITILASNEFKKSSLIQLGNYIINKNERKIIKDKLELKLTEKEINFLVLFTLHNEPISKAFILKNLWNYSPETNTHTIETHIHRLRKKILQKFEDSDFIKNDDKGYFI